MGTSNQIVRLSCRLGKAEKLPIGVMFFWNGTALYELTCAHEGMEMHHSASDRDCYFHRSTSDSVHRLTVSGRIRIIWSFFVVRVCLTIQNKKIRHHSLLPIAETLQIARHHYFSVAAGMSKGMRASG
jgi:hypothetical protein